MGQLIQSTGLPAPGLPVIRSVYHAIRLYFFQTYNLQPVLVSNYSLLITVFLYAPH